MAGVGDAQGRGGQGKAASRTVGALEPPGPMPGFQQHDWLKPDAASPHRSPALLLLPGAPAGDQSKNPTVRPWPARDKGRCCSCGDAAEPLPVTMADPVACVEAEKTNSTVARLRTKRYCAGCNPYHRPLCRGRICRETGQKRRVQPAGCCNITSTSRRRHCAKCCVGAAANRSAQVMPPTTIAAGTAARRTLGNERRARIRGLHCEGLDNRAIAHGLGVSVRTVPRALKAANDLATDRT